MSSNGTIDRFYTEFSKRETKVRNGGIDADKPGYHNKRGELIRDGRPNDYSISQVAADKRGDPEVSAGIDLTFVDAQAGDFRTIGLYSRRLRDACLRRDMRLWLYGGPVLREWIGNCGDGVVYCYVLTGGAPLGVGSDSGPDSGRDDSHEWHIHLSWIRQYAEDWAAADAVLSVMLGESLDAWKARTGRGNDVGELVGQQAQYLEAMNERIMAMALGRETITTSWSNSTPEGVEPNWTVQTLKATRDLVQAMLDGDDERAAELQQRLTEIDNAAAARAEQLKAEIDQVPEEVIGSLPAHTYERAIETLVAAGGRAWVAGLGHAIVERLNEPQS